MTVRRNGAPLVQPGPIPEYFVTGIAAMDNGDEYLRLTFCSDQSFGGDEVAERELVVRVVMPSKARAALMDALGPKTATVLKIAH